MYFNKIKQNKNTSAMVFSAMVVLIIAVFLLSVPVSVLADPLAYTAGMAFSAYAEAYGMAAGAGYDFINTSASDRTSIFLGEFDEWQAAKHSADSSYTPVSISDWESAHESDVSYDKIYGGPFLNGTPTIGDPAFYTCMKFNAVIANELNDFYNWFLNKLGLTYSYTSGGFAGQGGSFESPVYFAGSVNHFSVPVVSDYSLSTLKSSGRIVAWNGSASDQWAVFVGSVYSDVYVFGVGKYVYFASPSQGTSGVCNYDGQVNTTLSLSTFNRPYSLFYASVHVQLGFFNQPYNLNVYSSLDEGLAAVSSEIASPSLSSSAFIDPYLPTLVNDVISIPDVTSQDYVAEPVETVIGIPWDDLYADQDAIELVAPLVAEQAVGGTLELVEEMTAPIPPTDVQIPFLPVNLPSFALGLSGIWHYVREWVGSLRSFMGVLFGIWNGLPYAMIVPVWASAVIVIVLGIYKRFFM